MTMKKSLLAIFAAITLFTTAAKAADPDPAAKLADEILAKMTLEEKVSLCHGNSTFYINAIPRVGLQEEFAFSDGPHNVRPEVNRNSWGHVGGDKDYSTSLPPLTALAATWDTAAATRFGNVLGAEARDRGKDVILGPGVNIMRTPLNGRNFEYLGEDPALAAGMVAPLIRSIQSHDVATCVKHYALNNQELNRNGVDVEVDERALREIYLPAFRAAIVDGGSLTLMNAFNRVRGEFCSHNDYLNNQILKKEWGFKGFVVTDWGSLHDTVKGALGGTDVEMNSGANIKFFKQPLLDAVKSGKIPESVIDDKARRVLYVMARIHKIDGSVRQPGARNTPEHQAAAREIAESAIVLLKNDGAILPLDKTAIKSLLVIGSNAVRKHCTEGGSAMGKPPYEITPLAGLQRLLGDGVKIEHVQAPDADVLQPIPAACLTTTDPAAGVKGWAAEFFNNKDLAGEAVAKRYDSVPEFTWNGQSPMPGVKATNFSARWTATLTAPETGDYRIGISCDDGARLFIDGKLAVNSWTTGPMRTAKATVQLEAGKTYQFRAEYFQGIGDAGFSLGWKLPSQKDQTAFVALAAQAKAADAVLLFTGTNHDSEQEGGDRQNLKLSGSQDALVAALAGINPKTVIVNLSGAPVEMPWVNEARAIVQYWFCGQEGGNALARVLFGEVNPSGKLPFTFPRTLADSPAHATGNYNPSKVNYAEGVLVGYRWFDEKKIEPLFPFGFGLSYTTFKIGEPALSAKELRKGGNLTVKVAVTNTGKRAGAEVVQLYVADREASVPRPPKELKGFQKVFLQPGESKTVEFTVTPRDLSFWDVAAGNWKAEPGIFEIQIGNSSRNLTGKAAFELK
jgi:beta-glucosidase